MSQPENRLQISKRVFIPMYEIRISAMRAGGPGGQHVNKVATAVQLRFDIINSSLPDLYKQRLLRKKDRRITGEGIVIIKSQESRSQKKNREAALQRLRDLIRSVLISPKRRIATKPTRKSQQKRLESKSKQAQKKHLRKKIKDTD